MSKMHTTSMFKHTFVLLISLFLFASAAHADSAKKAEIVKMDRIVAIVDQAVITEKELAFYNEQLEFKAEPGSYNIFIGGDSRAERKASFTLL